MVEVAGRIRPAANPLNLNSLSSCNHSLALPSACGGYWRRAWKDTCIILMPSSITTTSFDAISTIYTASIDSHSLAQNLYRYGHWTIA